MNVRRLSGCKCKLTLSIVQLNNAFFEKKIPSLPKITSYQRNTICTFLQQMLTHLI